MFKYLRIQSGLSQTNAARALRINVGFWSRIESGDVDLPPQKYKRAAKVFKTSVKKLVEHRVSAFEKTLKSKAYGR